MQTRAVWIVSLWLKNQNVEAFEKLESAASTIMKKHGGRIERALRLWQPTANVPFEIHIVSFADEKSFEAYREDPDTAALARARDAVITRTRVDRAEDLKATYVAN